MRCGISTSCYFPEDTCESLRRVIAAGAKITEIFLNTFSEADGAYVEQLAALQRESGIEVAAVHPFSSMLDGYFFASTYATRLADGVAMYRRYFEICNILGAKKLVFHGDYTNNIAIFPIERYAENFKTLAAVGREYGVELLHENVYYCRLGKPDDVLALRPFLGGDAKFVLDIKQARRAKLESPREMLAAMDGGVRHVHISDYSAEKDCLLPGRGMLDFRGLIADLKAAGFDGDLIIEVYSDSFENVGEVAESLAFVQSLI